MVKTKRKFFGKKALARKIKKWSIEEICNAYSNLNGDRSIEAMDTKVIFIHELKSRNKEAFYLWLYDNTNLNNPGPYFNVGVTK